LLFYWGQSSNAPKPLWIVSASDASLTAILTTPAYITGENVLPYSKRYKTQRAAWWKKHQETSAPQAQKTPYTDLATIKLSAIFTGTERSL
jgi:hypothetical protein